VTERLSLRERVLLGVLVAFLSVAALTSFVVLPAFERMGALEAEIELLRQQRGEMGDRPDLTSYYRDADELARRDYKNYQRFYYPFMEPEAIDRTMTDMLLEYDLSPLRLAMTEPEPTDAPPPYVPSQSPESHPASTLNDAREQPEPAYAEEAATEPEATRAEGEDATTDSPIVCSTVDIEATGGMKQLFSFLERARTIPAMEIVSYTYGESEDASSGGGKDASSRWGTASSTSSGLDEHSGALISMQVKLYGFVEVAP
jgi:hypothetical protein